MTIAVDLGRKATNQPTNIIIHVNVMDMFQELPKNQYNGHCWVQCSNIGPSLCYKELLYM